MTTTEKLAEVEKEFARAGCDVEVSLAEPVCWPNWKCEQCGGRGLIFIYVEIMPLQPEKPTGKRAKAVKKWQEEMNEWFRLGSHIYVCADRPRCRLRRAKREYKKARREERARRRCERALKV